MKFFQPIFRQTITKLGLCYGPSGIVDELLYSRYIFNLLMHSYAHTHTQLVMDETSLNMIMILNFRKCSVVCQWMMLIVLFFLIRISLNLFGTSTFCLIHNGILFRWAFFVRECVIPIETKTSWSILTKFRIQVLGCKVSAKFVNGTIRFKRFKMVASLSI